MSAKKSSKTKAQVGKTKKAPKTAAAPVETAVTVADGATAPAPEPDQAQTAEAAAVPDPTTEANTPTETAPPATSQTDVQAQPTAETTAHPAPSEPPLAENTQPADTAAAQVPVPETNGKEGTKKGGKKKPAKGKGKKTSGKPKPEKLSALDAAARVLEESGQALTCKELIEAMAAKKYWTSPGGKTPQATLYAAILREIQAKGEQARFHKAERGKFALRGAV
jgi:HB1, ASXL, restriction endonuclease HTH domain